MERRCFVIGITLVLAACTTHPMDGERVRICSSAGCYSQPKDRVTTEPVIGDADTNEDQRVIALKAAADAEPRAAYDLGLRYFRGDGVSQNSYQALVWMRKAAERGDLDAQKALGVFYLFGLEEMGADPREAEKWLSIAAGRGDQGSIKLLAQARSAKKSDDDYYKWQTEWRGFYYRYWNTGYVYRGYWQGNAWHWH